MKILVDIIHPANVHYFKNFIFKMKSQGHEFIITARDKDETHKLLKAYKLKYKTTGSGNFGPGAIGKLLYIIYAEFLMLYTLIKHRPGLTISFCSTPVSHASFLLGIPHLTFDDTEHAKLNRSLYLPFVKNVVTPSCFTLDLGKKHVKIDSYMELFYLHPNHFRPNKEIFNYLKIEYGTPYIIIRLISWKAFHDIGEYGIRKEESIELVKKFSKKYKVYITSEGDIPNELNKYKIKIPVEKMHDALAFSSLYFGDGGTTASECAVLGVPAILISSSTTGYLSEEESKYDLLYRYDGSEGTFKKALDKANDILSDPNTKSKWKEKRDKLLKEKIDGSEFMINFVNENYIK